MSAIFGFTFHIGRMTEVLTPDIYIYHEYRQFSREYRQFSREYRQFSREYRQFSREYRQFSRKLRRLRSLSTSSVLNRKLTRVIR